VFYFKKISSSNVADADVAAAAVAVDEQCQPVGGEGGCLTDCGWLSISSDGGVAA